MSDFVFVAPSAVRPRARLSFSSSEWIRLTALYGFIGALHIVGWGGYLFYAQHSFPGMRILPEAEWTPYRASLLSSTTRADGFVLVGDDSEGFAAGADVEVWLYA